jgi:hypothetical protein
LRRHRAALRSASAKDSGRDERIRASKCPPPACSIRRISEKGFTDEIAEGFRTICIATLGNEPIELFQQAFEFNQPALHVKTILENR